MIFNLLFSLALAADPHAAHQSELSHEAQHESQHGPKHEAGKLKLNHGKKWETDEPLRTNMAKIRQTVQGNLPPEKYAAASQTIDESIQNIFKNCKLSPEADATLHLVLVDIMKGSSTLKKAHSDAEGRGGVELIHQALKNYETYFDDKGGAKL